MEAKDLSHINLVSNILDIRLVDCKIAETVPASLVGKLNKDKVQFQFNIEIRTDLVKKTFFVRLNTQLYADEAKTINLGHLISEGEFGILNLDEIITTFEGKVPNIIFANFVGVVIGTSRGFLITASKGTLMEGIFMPMINPLTFFAQPL